jgi:hypothetical protein
MPFSLRCTGRRVKRHMPIRRAGGTVPRMARHRLWITVAAVAAGWPVVRSATAEVVGFSTHVAPLLVKHCGSCHVSGRRGDFQFSSYDTLMKSGMVQKGQGSASRLVDVIATGDMPRGGGKVSQEELTMLSSWIDQGAKLDLLTETSSLDDVTAAGRARSLPDAELRQVRVKAGTVLWRMAIPDEEPVVDSRGRVHVIGNLPAAAMQETADLAVTAEAAVRKELAGDADLLRKGGVVLYVFRKSYDYSALWQQEPGGERPKGITGHGGTTGDLVYGAVVLPAVAPDEASVELLLAEQLAAGALAGRGLPDWFVKGAARTVAMRAVPKAKLVKDWKRESPAAVRAIGSAAEFFSVNADPAAVTLVSGGFVGAIATPSAKLRQLLGLVDGGQDFEAAFTSVFHGTPQALFDAWARKVAKKKETTGSAGRHVFHRNAVVSWDAESSLK